MTITSAQDRYITRALAAIHRWAHRPDGGHSGRTIRAARRQLRQDLERLGLTDSQVRQAITDAVEMLDLMARYGSEE